MSAILNGVWRFVAKWYRNSLRSRLAEYGLKYQDLYVEYPEVEKALSRLDPETLRARNLRIKRAFDLSAKKKTLPEEFQVGDPLEPYLQKELDNVIAEENERKILNGY